MDENPSEHVPDELDERLEELAEDLTDPERAGRTIEDQGEDDSLSDDNEQ